MNGRVYDPLLGRFLSPDNIVQAPGNSQSYNWYSYCLNNPFKYTDPSGYSILSKIGDGITNALNWLADEEDRFASWQYENHISSSANFSYDINLGGQSTVSVSVIPGETGSSSSSTAFTPSYRDYPDVNFDPGAQHFDSNSGLYSFNGGSSITSSQSSPSIGFSGNSESPWGTVDIGSMFGSPYCPAGSLEWYKKAGGGIESDGSEYILLGARRFLKLELSLWHHLSLIQGGVCFGRVVVTLRFRLLQRNML